MMVQTALIVKYATDSDRGIKQLARPMWSIAHMETAFDASVRIPENVSARRAAEVFIRWTFEPNTIDSEAQEILEALLPDDFAPLK